MVARAELTLPKPSRLSMIDRSTAGAADDGERAGGIGFFPFPFFVGAMVTGDKGHNVFTQVRALSMEVIPYSCLINIDDMGSTRVDLP